MLTGAGLGDETGLAHLLGQQCLPQHVVDLVSAGVVQVLPFQVDLRTAQVTGHLLRIVQQRGATGIFIQQLI